MADIDSIIAGVNGNTRYDFSTFGDPIKAYEAGLDIKQKKLERNVFSDGMPTNADGTPNYGEAAKRLYQIGNIQQGSALSNLDLQRQQLALGQQASAALGRVENGGGGVPVNTPTLPPSTSRNGGAVVAAPISGTSAPQAAQPSQKGGNSLMQIVAAAGFPNDQLGTITASIGRQLGVDDPNAPIDINDPQVRNVLVPAIQRYKQMGLGQVVQPGQQAPQSAPQPVAQPQQPAPTFNDRFAINPQQNQGTFGAPLATPTRGAVPTGNDPEIQKQIATYTAIASNPAFPKATQDTALARLKALQEQGAPTGPMKEYDLYRRQGGDLKFSDWLADNESKKTAATEEAKLGAKKYEGLIEAGIAAQREIPQIEMVQEAMNDPNFYSGSGEKYNLLYKRLKSAVGIDPNAAVPQEMLRKVTSSSILGGLGSLKGLGQIRNAEISLVKEASAAPDNSIPANKLLVEISKRTHQRNADIAEMAQSYKQENGTLDAGFDKKVTAYGKSHPLLSDAEIKDWHKAIGEFKQTPASPGGMQRFASPNDVHAALASGKIKKGDRFTDPNGVVRVVP